MVSTAEASFTYADVWDATVPAGGVWQNTFRLNSLYDPDYTGVGGAPSGVSTYLGVDKPFYRYRVNSVDVDIRAINTTAAQSILAGVMAGGDDIAVPATGAVAQQTLLEGRSYAWDFLNSTTGGEHSYGRMTCHIKIADVVGPIANDQNCTAPISANPSLSAFLVLLCCNADGSTLSATARFVVRLTYNCTLFERMNGISD